MYQEYLKENPESNAALNNLANIFDREGDYETAIELYNKALQVESDDETAQNNLKKTLNRKREQTKQEAQKQREKEQQLQVQKTAKIHWPSLDYYKKKVLMVLSAIDRFEGFAHLAKLCNIDERWIETHYDKLVNLGMIIIEDQKYRINPDIIPLLERESSHSVAINIIRSDESILFKPIFNSKLEYDVYRIMIGLFPNHLVFPNMSLQSIFQYKRLKEVLEQEVFTYYLMASVDICVVSTANYFPIISFEVDSPYHDEPAQMVRDEKKNEIFRIGGVPLIRLRPHGKPSEAEMRQQIITSTQEFGADLDPQNKRNEMFLNLLKNLE